MATTIDAEAADKPTPSFLDELGSHYWRRRSRQLRFLAALLRILASLKLTVVLFAMALVIVFVGTLAQTRADIWEVVHTYFRSAYVWIPFQVFFPKSFFPEMKQPIDGSFPFLGGWAIGGMMAINLLAAHLVRFKIQAKGARLAYGLATIAVGCFVTWGVIAAGSGTGFQVTALDPTMRIFWQLLQGTFAGAVLLAGCWLVFGKRAGVVVLHGGVGLMMFSELLVGTSAIEAQMHIVEGETVNFVQDIRTNELAVIDSSDPATDTVVPIPQRFLKDGETIKHDALPFDIKVVKYLQNSELDSVNPKDANPATKGIGLEMIAREAKAGVGASSDSKVDDSAVYVEVLKKGTTESLGTYLLSLLQSRFNESRERSGFSDAELRSRTGPFVVKMSEPVVVAVDGKPYQLALRFKRTYKPYSFTLKDVRAEKYLGTQTPKDYSSIVHLKMDSPDPAKRVDRDDVRIWMNNPLRFHGETFYQSNVGVDPISQGETTGLQVVTNTGWMIPYVSCMIVAVGMLFQFSVALLRFLGRRQAATALRPAPRPTAAATSIPRRQSSAETIFMADNLPEESVSMPEKLFTAGVLLAAVGLVAFYARPSEAPDGALDLDRAGRIPIVYEGRVKPLDTLARNTLKVISGSESVKDSGKKSQPAIRWLLDVIAGREQAQQYRVFRIDNISVLDRLGLEWRDGHRYSLEELRGKDEGLDIDEIRHKPAHERTNAEKKYLDVAERIQAFNADVTKAREKPADQLTVDERKLLELDRRIKAFTAIEASCHRPNLPDPDDRIRSMARSRGAAIGAQLDAEEARMIEKAHPPLTIPVKAGEGTAARYSWKPMISAFMKDYFDVQVLEKRKSDPAVAAWDAILSAYLKDSPSEFSKALAKYETLLANDPPPELASAATSFEAYYNHFSPFHVASGLYVIGFVLSVFAWMGWTKPLNRTAYWLIVLTFCLHTFALASRMYISGRPPVTNLYSSAVFIGWGCVALGLAFEWIFRLGIGNVLSAIAGFLTLQISFILSADGDTFTVLQAVLDTQLWLATHVTCVTMGYAATFMAGLLGLAYIACGVVPVKHSSDVEKVLGRMTYGTLCFAIFFSFVGTVLGGLWADDSWGRFWGWDPKENGALMIVLWNALVLHARWDGMVKNRGLAILAVGGNIVTGWSWFGVNELGVGLHSYGFTAGVLLTLGIVVGGHLLVIAAAALVPKEVWWSYSKIGPKTESLNA